MPNRLKYLGAAVATFALLGAVTLAIAGPYGALATSPSAAFGYSNNYDDLEAAKSRALTECTAVSTGCEVKQTFENTCVSIFKAGNGAMGWSWGHGRDEDNRLAMESCRNNKGEDCTSSARFCTGNP